MLYRVLDTVVSGTICSFSQIDLLNARNFFEIDGTVKKL